MAQCEKVLDSGERCSNQAIPGTSYCQIHKPRIMFRPAPGKERADTAPLPTLTTQAEAEPQPAESAVQQDWKASPSAADQKPAFPGLQSDERTLLVAPQGIIWLQAEPEDTPASQFQRLVRLLSLLSQSFPLSGQVKVLFQAKEVQYILRLMPTQQGTEPLSVFYDAASDATRLVNGRIYVGQERAFVQYRDDGAPRGYDVPAFKAPDGGDDVLLVARWGTQKLSLSGFSELTLRDLSLRVMAQPAMTDQVPEQVYALVPPPLYRLLAKYFHAHHLRYRLARLQAPTGALMLFEIGPRPDAPIGQVVPAFILDYLTRLPRVTLLVQAPQTDDRMILLQWKHRYPLHIPHILGEFTPDELLLLMAGHYPNMLIKPVPQFFDGDRLVDAHFPNTEVVHLQPLPDSAPATLKLEILLHSDNGPVPPVAALILSPQEMVWLRRLLYLLDGDAFSAYMLYQGEELSILIGNNRPVEGLPFGTPLRRPGNRGLFIPVRSRFMPDVPWPLLQEALMLQERTYTFLTAEYRLDVSETLFTPLSRALVAAQRPRVNVHIHAPTVLPSLVWTSPPEPAVEVPPEKMKKGQSPVRRLFPSFQQPAKENPVVPVQNSKFDENALWREKAGACEEAKDFLAAAVCYTFLNDLSNSARCYRLAATQLKTQEGQGG